MFPLKNLYKRQRVAHPCKQLRGRTRTPAKNRGLSHRGLLFPNRTDSRFRAMETGIDGVNGSRIKWGLTPITLSGLQESAHHQS
jgi:hypothetical protein